MTTNVQFTGHLGADPEIQFGKSGAPWVRLRVAVNRRVKRGDEWVDATPTWWDVTASDDLAANIDESLRQGDPITVIGRVITETYTDKKTGEEKTATKVRADQIAVPLSRHVVKIRKAPRAASNDDRHETETDASAGEPSQA